ncbi:tripartite motif-containing protein 59 [Heteronotia binoei]|uniref:tripartite motif-containing protein 59 n=1 Tax=Heteronotia binoei TaxID=13085 RepID=UPI002930046B|nr:tripartite motif-containing protein 59 [Heteronotia binoei]XP_060098408.1 tripartite motif-containing protein 59 [Heteronotia binoei]XP_060098409.1 tripartite motif-containing protein 59 [Heteronotia binoei]XP_060098410.1 tripartite motif-containing protein 59 [Heteronotia binoei]
MHHFEEELTCSICYSIYEDPRVLPCSHTFCRNCLESVLQLSSNFSIWRPLRLPLKCPNCRSIVEIPPSGTDSLPINFALKAIIEKYQQDDHPDVATCTEHYRQPLNVYCLLDKKLVCGHCLTIGKHHGHPIDDLLSAYMKEKETPSKLLEQLTDKHWSEVCLLIENLEEQKAKCESIVQEDKKTVLQYFKRLNDVLDHKKQALLAALDEVNTQIAAEYEPLIERMKGIREEQLELMSLNTSIQEEESPLLFLEKVEDVRQRVKALKKKPLPSIRPVEIYPRIGQVLKDVWTKTEISEINKIITPQIKLISKGKVCHGCEKENSKHKEFWPLLLALTIISLVVAHLLSAEDEVAFPYVLNVLENVYHDSNNRLQAAMEVVRQYLCKVISLFI